MQKKNNLLKENEIKEIINDALYDAELISDEIYEKCGKPKYIQSLPYDNRTSDPEKLQERKNEIETRMEHLESTINNENKDIDTLNNEFNEGIEKIYESERGDNLEYNLHLGDVVWGSVPPTEDLLPLYGGIDNFRELESKYTEMIGKWIAISRNWDANYKNDSSLRESIESGRISKVDINDKVLLDLADSMDDYATYSQNTKSSPRGWDYYKITDITQMISKQEDNMRSTAKFIRDGQTLYNDIFNQLEVNEVECREKNAKAIVDAMAEKLG